jgi:hypothetical protein
MSARFHRPKPHEPHSLSARTAAVPRSYGVRRLRRLARKITGPPDPVASGLPRAREDTRTDRSEPHLSCAGGWPDYVSDGLHVPRVGSAAATEDGDRRVLRPQPQVIDGQLHRVADVEDRRLIEFGMAQNERITLFALSGVPTVEERTRPRSCHSAPARRRSFAWSFRCSRSASTQRRGSARVLRDFPVLVSPPFRRERQT